MLLQLTHIFRFYYSCFFNEWPSLILSVLVKPTQALYKNSTVFKLRFSLSLTIENLQPSLSLKAAIHQKKKYMWKKIFKMWFAGIKLLICNSEESIVWFMGPFCEHRELRYKISILLNVSEEAFEKSFQFKHDLNQFRPTQVLISCWFSFPFQSTDITIAHCLVTLLYLVWRPFVSHGGNQEQQSNNGVVWGHNLRIKSFKKEKKAAIGLSSAYMEWWDVGETTSPWNVEIRYTRAPQCSIREYNLPQSESPQRLSLGLRWPQNFPKEQGRGGTRRGAFLPSAQPH